MRKFKTLIRILLSPLRGLFALLKALPRRRRKAWCILRQEGWRGLRYSLEERYRPTDRQLYKLWQKRHRLTADDRDRIGAEIEKLPYRLVISILLPVYNIAEIWLRKCMDSVLGQLYPHWELCIADDASTAKHIRRVLEEYQARDRRIRVVFREVNGHISAASNSALSLATGEYVALLDHDDELTPDALYEMASLISRNPEADMIYSDEDKMDERGRRHSPFFKPDWSPDYFLSQMYTCHLGVYRTELVRSIGGFRVGFEGSQDYDLVLRLTEKTDKIHHIPKVLYHWRTIQGSTALTYDSKHYAYKAGLRAIQEALDRRREGGWVENVVNFPGQYLVHYPVAGRPLISIAIPTKDHPEILDRCLKSIFMKSSYEPFEVIIVDNGSVREETLEMFDSWKNKEPDRFGVVRLDIPFNFSRLVNEGVRRARGELVLLLNDDVEVLSETWLEEMAGQAQRQSIGAVGAFLLYPDRTLQHVGLILGVLGPANHAHRFAREGTLGYFGRLLVVTNYAAVTGACLMVKRDLFIAVNGFDEELAIAYNDVDFCLRLLNMGYRNVVLPQVRLYHHESKSRGSDAAGENRLRLDRESEILRKRWAAWIQNDPYYSPHLTRDRIDSSIGAAPPAGFPDGRPIADEGL
ncbi:MAG: glycosyltransferase family 2 protein [Syntrophales bacterium]